MRDSDSGGGQGRSGLTLSGFVQTITLVLGALGTAAGVWNNIRVSENQQAISDLQTQLQLSEEFATGVEATRKYITTQAGTTATVELVRLYALASTPQEKIAVLEVAADSGQLAAVRTLIALVQLEPFYIHPANDSERAAKESLDTIVAASAQSTLGEETPSPKPSPTPRKARGATKPAPSPVRTPFSDSPLTQSSNKKVAASAALLAGLNEAKAGWIFVGDSYPSPSPASAHLFAETATTSKAAVPQAGDTLCALSDLNLRSYPFVGGKLGPPVGVIQAHTAMVVTAPQAGQEAVISVNGIGKVSGKPIKAYWAHVQQDNSSGQASC
jgi:hypothetical protein